LLRSRPCGRLESHGWLECEQLVVIRILLPLIRRIWRQAPFEFCWPGLSFFFLSFGPFFLRFFLFLWLSFLQFLCVALAPFVHVVSLSVLILFGSIKQALACLLRTSIWFQEARSVTSLNRLASWRSGSSILFMSVALNERHRTNTKLLLV